MRQRAISDDSNALSALGCGEESPRSALPRVSQPSARRMAPELERTSLGVPAQPTYSWDGLLRDVATERSLEEDLSILPDGVALPNAVEHPMIDVLPQIAHKIRNALSPIPYCLALMETHPGDLQLERHVASTISNQVEQIAHLLDALEAGGERPVPPIAARSVAETILPELDRRWSLRIALDMPLNTASFTPPASSSRIRTR